MRNWALPIPGWAIGRKLSMLRERAPHGTQVDPRLAQFAGALREFWGGRGLRRLVKQHEADIHGNIDCVQLLGLDCLKRGDLDGSFDMFRKCLSLTSRVEYFPGWPVPEPRIRHDYEQLELLQQRGRLTESGALALPVLKRYYDRTGDVGKALYRRAATRKPERGIGEFHYWRTLLFRARRW